MNRYKCQPIGQISIETTGSGGMVLSFEFSKVIHVALRSKYSHNSTSRQILFLFTTGMMKHIALDLVLFTTDMMKHIALDLVLFTTGMMKHIALDLVLFTTGMMKHITLDLVFERPLIYKLHTICYRTRLVYHMDEFWTIIDRDCANKSTVDRLFCVPLILEGNCLCQL